VDRERIAWFTIAALLLIAGLLFSRSYPPPASSPDVDPFRQRFWESRGLDIVAQVGLVFAGALGIAALMPLSKEEDE
jgi:hypothetical protein